MPCEFHPVPNTMHSGKHEGAFDARKVAEVLKAENKFAADLFSVLCLPARNEEQIEDEEEEVPRLRPKKTRDTTRAQSLSELQQRLHAITDKKRLTYKEKLAKKGLKNRLKKKSKQDERNAKQKLLRAHKIMDSGREDAVGSVKTEKKPAFNSEGKLVFSKIDFSNFKGPTKNKKKAEKDPKKALKNLEKHRVKLEELEESGEIDKVIEIKEKTAWKNALSKAEGAKVKDDPILLKKSVHKQEQKKRASKKKWEKRNQNVEKMKKERQEKRTRNIEKRKKEKQKKKIKRAVKKGKIIPGY